MKQKKRAKHFGGTGLTKAGAAFSFLWEGFGLSGLFPKVFHQAGDGKHERGRFQNIRRQIQPDRGAGNQKIHKLFPPCFVGVE